MPDCSFVPFFVIIIVVVSFVIIIAIYLTPRVFMHVCMYVLLNIMQASTVLVA
jgi:hypothetical protein